METNFYLFLDIDGVLYDFKFLLNLFKTKSVKKDGRIQLFKPESIDALNLLTTEISKQYNFNLVISSSWKMNMEKTKRIFNKYKIIGAEKMSKTPNAKIRNHRGKEILQYLKEHNFNKTHDDFLIIDDELFDFEKYFSKDKIIKTSIKNNSLSLDMVKKHLDKNYENLTKIEEKM